MKNNRPNRQDANIFLSVLGSMFRWFASLLGVCLVAGVIGAGAGLYVGLPFMGALGAGVLAILIVLGLWLYMMSESGPF